MPIHYDGTLVGSRRVDFLVENRVSVELKAVEIEVFEFQLQEINDSLARFTVECGSGTYIRSLAHEMGAQLGTGAHLAAIVRTAVGEFAIDQAISLGDLEQRVRAGRAAECIVPLGRLLSELPRASVLPAIERRVRNGSRFQVPLAQIQPGYAPMRQGATTELNSGEWKPARLRVFNQQEQLIAIAEAVVPRTYQPLVVLDAEH